MKLKTAKTIARIWKNIEDGEPDISTEQLMARTADEASRLIKHDIDCGDVGEALYMLKDTADAV